MAAQPSGNHLPGLDVTENTKSGINTRCSGVTLAHCGKWSCHAMLKRQIMYVNLWLPSLAVTTCLD